MISLPMECLPGREDRWNSEVETMNHRVVFVVLPRTLSHAKWSLGTSYNRVLSPGL